MPTLIVNGPGGFHVRYAWTDGSVGIGSDDSNHLTLAHPDVEPWHAAIYQIAPDTHRLRDLGSATGLRVNGAPALWHDLRGGEGIEIDPYRILYERSCKPQRVRAPAQGIVLEATASDPLPSEARAEPISVQTPWASVLGRQEVPDSMRLVFEGLDRLGRSRTWFGLLQTLVLEARRLDPSAKVIAGKIRRTPQGIEFVDRTDEASHRLQARDFSRTLVIRAVDSGLPLLARIPADGGPIPASITALAIGTGLCVPFEAGGEVRAVFYSHWRYDRDPPREETLRVVSALASYACLLFDPLYRLQLADSRLRARAPGRAAAGVQQVVGVSSVIRDTTARLDRIARSPNSLLLLGESGVGKEVLARRAHDLSRGATAPFVHLNCGGLPETLIEAELFGQEKGAATGIDAKPGAFRDAHGGTLFLDEFDALPLLQQVRLLVVLDRKEVVPLGGRKDTPIPVDVRVIAGTNADLRGMIADDRFRFDLFMRFVHRLAIPPLRERKEDIPILAYYFLDTSLEAQRKGIVRISSDVMQMFMRYDWPGNVRELKNTLLAVVDLCEPGTETLEPHHVRHSFASDRPTPRRMPAKLAAQEGEGDGAGRGATGEPHESQRVPTLEEVERQAIRHALAQSHGSVNAAAKLLDVSWDTVRKRMLKYGWSESDFRE